MRGGRQGGRRVLANVYVECIDSLYRAMGDTQSVSPIIYLIAFAGL